MASTQLNMTGPALVVVAGEDALDGSNPTPVVTGLKNILAFTATLKKNTAPGVATTSLTYDFPADGNGTVQVYGWKPTSSADCTLIASTGTETFGWHCIGSR